MLLHECPHCGSNSFVKIENGYKCEYCDSVFVDTQNPKNPFIEYEEYLEKKAQEQAKRIQLEEEERVKAVERQLKKEYNRCIEIEAKRKLLNSLFITLMIISFILSAITSGVYALFSVVFLFCIVWNDSRQKTRNAQAFIKDYLSKRV